MGLSCQIHYILSLVRVETARARSDDPTPYPPYSTNVWGAIQNVWGIINFVWRSPYMHGARSTVLRAFSHFHAIYRCFPYNSARNSYELVRFPLHLQYAVQLGILTVKSTNQPELGSNLGHV